MPAGKIVCYVPPVVGKEFLSLTSAVALNMEMAGDRHFQLRWGMPGLHTRSPIKVDEWYKLLGHSANVREIQRQACTASTNSTRRHSARGDPDWNTTMQRSRYDPGVGQRRPVPP